MNDVQIFVCNNKIRTSSKPTPQGSGEDVRTLNKIKAALVSVQTLNRSLIVDCLYGSEKVMKFAYVMPLCILCTCSTITCLFNHTSFVADKKILKSQQIVEYVEFVKSCMTFHE